MTEAAPAAVDGVVLREICIESSEVLNPGVFIIPEREIDHLLLALLRDIERMASLPLISEEAENVDRHSQPFLDCWDVVDGDGVTELVLSKVMKEVGVLSRSIGVCSSRERTVPR